MSDPIFLTLDEVLQIHSRSLAEHGGIDGTRDPGLVEKLDLRENYGEERVALAMLNGQILVVVYTERKDIIRIISARRANKHEQQNYYSQIGT